MLCDKVLPAASERTSALPFYWNLVSGISSYSSLRVCTSWEGTTFLPKLVEGTSILLSRCPPPPGTENIHNIRLSHWSHPFCSQQRGLVWGPGQTKTGPPVIRPCIFVQKVHPAIHSLHHRIAPFPRVDPPPLLVPPDKPYPLKQDNQHPSRLNARVVNNDQSAKHSLRTIKASHACFLLPIMRNPCSLELSWFVRTTEQLTAHRGGGPDVHVSNSLQTRSRTGRYPKPPWHFGTIKLFPTPSKMSRSQIS